MVTRSWRSWALPWSVALIAALLQSGAAAAEKEMSEGERLYRRHCASCHGVSGEGDGPDAPYFEARPRNLREGFLNKYSTEDLVKRIRSGRTLALALDLPALQARATEVESIVAHMRRLPAVNWRRVEAGWEMYIARCEGCHGMYGAPPADLAVEMRPPRDLAAAAFQDTTNDRALMQSIRSGHHFMPALIPRISESQATELVAFVRLLSPGFETYSRNCAACHGDDGRGVGSLGEVMQMPTVAFDRAYFSRRDPEDIRHAVWHMLERQKPAMPHFRWTLSAAQVRKMVEYLQRTEPRAK